jgi:hypothetical protein
MTQTSSSAVLEEAKHRLESGAFTHQSPVVQGDEVRALIGRLEMSERKDADPATAWSVIRNLVGATLEGVASYQSAARSGGRKITVGSALYGISNRKRFAGIGVDDVDQAAARLVGLVGPGLVSVVPEPLREWTLQRAAV